MNTPVCTWDKHFGNNNFFYSQNNTIFHSQADRGSRKTGISERKNILSVVSLHTRYFRQPLRHTRLGKLFHQESKLLLTNHTAIKMGLGESVSHLVSEQKEGKYSRQCQCCSSCTVNFLVGDKQVLLRMRGWVSLVYSLPPPQTLYTQAGVGAYSELLPNSLEESHNCLIFTEIKNHSLLIQPLLFSSKIL